MFIIITLYVQQLKRNHRKRKHSEEQNVVTSGKEEKNETHFIFQKSLLATCCSVLYLQGTELENTSKQNIRICHIKR